MNINDILAILPSYTQADEDLIRRAYAFASEAHKEHRRKSGQPYIVHPFNVALILAEMSLDAETLAAAFLHDTVEDCNDISIDTVEHEFGKNVAQLVHGVTKMESLPKQANANKAKRASNEQQAEYLRQMFIAMGNDVRVILIKLADRLDNMRTLGFMSRESQLRNARETLDIFAPMANRLGIGHLKWQLEDLSFRYLEPDQYKDIALKLAERRGNREIHMQRVIKQLEQALDEHNIKANVNGRPKHIYSIYRKMMKKQVPFEQIFDVRAVRVLVDDIPTCYQVLGIVHTLWRPIHGEFDDYIAAPKENGYRSLHTAIVDEEGKTLEVQIRTHQMHYENEYGVAAHWRYKESGRKSDASFEQRINYMRRLLETVQDEAQDAEQFVAAMKETIGGDRIYVFTPRNDIIDLPDGATPIDFAYHIHTEVGNRCRGARVNNQMVGLDHRLRTGDRVEIITANRGGPSLDWLNSDLGYTRTQRARQKIKQWFRKQDRDKNISLGRDALERELKRLGMEEYVRADIARIANYPSIEHMLAAIGFGDVTAASIVAKVVQLEQRQEEEKRDELLPSKPTHQKTGDHGIDVAGLGGLLVSLASCCHPAPGDPIIGFITRARGVTVHRFDCKNVQNTTERERLIRVNWSNNDAQVYSVPIEIKARDRGGLMRDIGGIIAEQGINMTNVNINLSDKSVALFRLVMEVSHVSQLSLVLNKIDMMPEVIYVRRLMSSASPEYNHHASV